MGAALLSLALGGLNFAKAGWEAFCAFLGKLDGRGWVELTASLIGAALLLHFAMDARHWKKQDARDVKALQAEKSAFDQTVANYRTAAAKQKADEDAKNARTQAQQQAVNQERDQSYEARIAAARAALAAAQRMQQHSAAAANPGSVSGTSVPAIATPSCGTDTPATDPVTRAFDCAIQLDELITWTQQQHAIDPNAPAPKPSDPQRLTTSPAPIGQNTIQGAAK